MVEGRAASRMRAMLWRVRRAVGLTEVTVRWLWRGAMFLAVVLGLGLAGLAWRIPLARPAFVARLEQATGYPLTVGRAALGRAGLRPAVVLYDVRLQASAGVAGAGAAGAGADSPPTRAARVWLGLSWNALLTGHLRVTTLVIEDLETAVACSARGRCRWVPQGPGQYWGTRGAAVDPAAAAGWLARLAAFDAVTIETSGIGVLTPDGRRVGQVRVERASFERVAAGFRVLARVALPAAIGRYVEFETQVRGDPARRASWRGDWVLRGRGLDFDWAARWQAPGVHIEAKDLLAALHGRWQDGEVAALAFDITARRVAALRDTGPLAEWRDIAVHGRLAPPGSGHPDAWWGRLDDLSTATWRGTTGRLSVEACAVFPACPVALALDDLPGLAILAPWLSALRYSSPAARFLEDSRGSLEGVVVARGASGLAASGRVDGFTRLPGVQGLGFGPVSGRFALDGDRGWFVADPDQRMRLAWPAVLGSSAAMLVPRSALVWRREGPGWRLTGPRLEIAAPGLAKGAVVVDPEIVWPSAEPPAEVHLQVRLTDVPWSSQVAWFSPLRTLALAGGWPAGLVADRVIAGRLAWSGPLVADVRLGEARRDAHWLWRGRLAGLGTAGATGAARSPVLSKGAGTLVLSPTELTLALDAGDLGSLHLRSMRFSGRPGQALSWQAHAVGPGGPGIAAWLPESASSLRVAAGGRLEIEASGQTTGDGRLEFLDTRLVAHDLRLASPGQQTARLSGKARFDAFGRWLDASFTARQGLARFTTRLWGRNLLLDGVGTPPVWLGGEPASADVAAGPAVEPPAGGPDGAAPAMAPDNVPVRDRHWHAEISTAGQPGMRVRRFDWRDGAVPADPSSSPIPPTIPPDRAPEVLSPVS